MYNTGYKVVYIVSVLSSKYRISEREIYKIINRMKKNCAPCSV
jgi:Mor family transcriptional regulator